jgi:hypothetical protein
VLGEDYTQAPTCATCHMSGHSRNDGEVTHDPGERISWTNRPPISLVMDTDENGKVIKETDPSKRRKLVHSSWQEKREQMQLVCQHCHTDNYVDAFYKQYDDFVVNYNEKFAKPGTKIMEALLANNLRTKPQFDEEIEWTWFYLWHHEGRRARHGASMMAPDYSHWHGMYEVAERFYMELIPQAREMAEEGRHRGNEAGAAAVEALIEEILARPEHAWFQKELVKLHGTPAHAATEDAAEASPAEESADKPEASEEEPDTEAPEKPDDASDESAEPKPDEPPESADEPGDESATEDEPAEEAKAAAKEEPAEDDSNE